VRNPDLTIVIVSWNVRELLLTCLSRIAQRSDSLDVEVIVVDNASTDDTVRSVREAFPDAMVIANRANVGFPAANNQGLAHARGRYVLYLNPDTEVGEGTLETCARELDREPEVGMVGCRLVLPDGRTQYEGGRRDYRLRHLVWEAFYLHEIFREHPVFAHQLMGDWDHRGRRDVEAILGAFMMARREVLTSIGGMPEEVFMSHEDLALCLRVRAAGHRVRYLGDVETLHHVGASRGRATSALDLLEGEVRVRLIRERGGPVRARLARPLFAFRSAARLSGAVLGRVIPGLADLKARRPKAFSPGVHAFHLLWSVAPRTAGRFLPRPERTDGVVVFPPREGTRLDPAARS
jgi:GT2 family glycosyltransferase